MVYTSKSHVYGTVKILFRGRDGIERIHEYPLDRIQNTIVQLILAGFVVSIEKTKAGRKDHLNGKNVVTIGPYKRATDVRITRYAVYIGNDKTEYLSPVEAAREYIAWVGHKLAREAVRELARKHR